MAVFMKLIWFSSYGITKFERYIQCQKNQNLVWQKLVCVCV